MEQPAETNNIDCEHFKIWDSTTLVAAQVFRSVFPSQNYTADYFIEGLFYLK